MTDIIWGNGSDTLSSNSFILKVSHRKNGNKENYSDIEKLELLRQIFQVCHIQVKIGVKNL